jgi:bifunctional non-homologous end joining protein LigD
MKFLSPFFLVSLCVVLALMHRGMAKKDTPSFIEQQLNIQVQKNNDQNELFDSKIENQQVLKEQLFAIHKVIGATVYYDLYIEHNGSLLAWRLPQGPSCNPQKKRVALKKENKPLDYALFEGLTSTGGKTKQGVLVWDFGSVTFDGPVTDKSVHVVLHGKRLQGGYSLNNIEQREWVFSKDTDSFADRHKNITRLYGRSALSDKTIKQILYAKKGA